MYVHKHRWDELFTAGFLHCKNSNIIMYSPQIKTRKLKNPNTPSTKTLSEEWGIDGH